MFVTEGVFTEVKIQRDTAETERDTAIEERTEARAELFRAQERVRELEEQTNILAAQVTGGRKRQEELETLLATALPFLEMHDDMGYPDEGWKSPELEKLVADVAEAVRLAKEKT